MCEIANDRIEHYLSILIRNMIANDGKGVVDINIWAIIVKEEKKGLIRYALWV